MSPATGKKRNLAVEADPGGFPINRIVAFIGPYVAVVAGVLASWLTTKVHVLGLFHLGGDQLAQMIAQVAMFGITAVLIWIGQHKWLSGWQQFEDNVHKYWPPGGVEPAPSPSPAPAPAPTPDPGSGGDAPVPGNEPLPTDTSVQDPYGSPLEERGLRGGARRSP